MRASGEPKITKINKLCTIFFGDCFSIESCYVFPSVFPEYLESNIRYKVLKRCCRLRHRREDVSKVGRAAKLLFHLVLCAFLRS